MHAEIGINWFLDQGIPKGGYVRILAESLLWEERPSYTRTSNQLAHTQACMVCMYACVHIGVHCWQDGVSLRGSNTDGNPSHGSVGWKPLVWVCHVLYYFLIETRQTSHRSPICRGVHLYVSTHVHTWVHLHACVWVGLGKLHG